MSGALRALRRPAVAGALAFAGLFIAFSSPITAQVSKEQTGPCEFTFTIPIEIYGPRATPENAADWKKQIEEVWNGPTESMALKIFEDSQLRKDNPELFKKPRDMRDTIRRVYREMFGDGMQINCCTIKFVADIRVRAEDVEPTAGYNQVHAMPAHYGEWDTLGKIPLLGEYIGEYQIQWFRSKVYHRPDAPDDLPGGEWAHEPDFPAYAHEVGHLLGIKDYYQDKVDENGHTHSEALPGHENDLMGGDMQGFLKDEHLKQILDFHNVTCNCCPLSGLDAMLQSFAITSRAAGDAMVANNCAVLRQTLSDLEDQRRNAQATPLPIMDKYDFLKRLDEKIDQVRKAWLACTPEPSESLVTGGFQEYGLSTDSSTFCTYDNGLPTPIDGLGAPPAGTSTPGTTPGSTPQPGGGIQGPPAGGDEPETTPPRPGLVPPRPGLTPVVTTPPPPGGDVGDRPRETPPPAEDAPQDVPVTVYMKAKKSVLQADGTRLVDNAPQPGQRLKLIVPDLLNPALPLAGNDKDIASGAADDPLQCTTDDNGECEIESFVVSGSRINRIDIEVPVQNVKGGVIAAGDTTTPEVPEGGEVTGRFTLGGKDYLRLRWDAGLDLGYRLKLDGQYDWHEDLCKDEQPGPWSVVDLGRFRQPEHSLPHKILSRDLLHRPAAGPMGAGE